MSKALLTILVLVLCSGCASQNTLYPVQVASVVEEAIAVKYQYDVAKLALEDKRVRAIFTDEEWATLQEADAMIEALMGRITAMGQFTNPSVSYNDIAFMYNLAKEAYTKAREVVLAHMDEFQPSTRIMLHTLDNSAVMISKHIENTNLSSAQQTLQLITGLVGITASILRMVVL